MSKGNKKVVNQNDIVDVEYTITPKKAAVAVGAAYGSAPQKRFETPEQKWEDLEELFTGAGEGIIQVGIQVNTALAQPGVKENLESPAEVNLAVQGLQRDLHAFTEDLARIHERHVGKTGVIKGVQDQMLSISVFEDYVNHNTQFKAVTLPTVLTIMDYVGSACTRMMAQFEQQQAQEVATAEQVTETKEA